MPSTTDASALTVRDLGRVPYAEADAVQRDVHARVVAGDAGPTLLLVEHDPVITVSRRKAASGHVLASEERLRELGIDVQPTDRGGDVTYHGPGQLVAYPIIRLSDYGLNVGRYMRLLEQVIIDTVAAFGVQAVRDPDATGVWVDVTGAASRGVPPWNTADAPCATSESLEGQACEDSDDTAATRRGSLHKIAAIGVRVSRGVTLHGLALNVTTDLSHFETIVPCGLEGRGVTSLRSMAGCGSVDLSATKQLLSDAAAKWLTSG